MVLVSILEFTTETVVLLFSGCVSLVTLSGLCAGVTFLACKQLNYFGSKRRSSVSLNIKVDVCNEPVSKNQKAELTSQPESNLSVTEGRLRSDEFGEPKTLRTFGDYLQIKVAPTTASNYDKDGEIREYLEHLVGRLISENLDDVPLTPLSDDERYAKIFSQYHSKISNILTTLSESLHSNKDSESLDNAVRPSTLYGQLQSVIREAREDTKSLPPLTDSDAEFGPISIETQLEGQSYEDILTTAVLNKIVSQSQIENGYASKKSVASDRIRVENRNSSPNKKFSLLIEERIEEVTTRHKQIEDETDSIVETSTNVNALSKHRAQFPELGKDIVDARNVTGSTKTNYIYKYDFNSSLETPTFKNDVDNDSEGFGNDHDLDSSGVTSISRDVSSVYSFSSASPCRSDEESLPWSGIREAKNDHLLLGQVDSGEGSLETQPENEYLNHDEICETATSQNRSTCEAYNIHATGKYLHDDDSSLVQDLSTPPKPGTIAEREHQKWEHAAPIPNNPYSKENLEKRSFDNFLPRTCGISTIGNQYERNKFDNTMNGAVSMNDISKYERDYYVNTNDKKSEESKIERRTRSMSREERPSQNGFGHMSDNESAPERRQTNLVRLSSWSDRKKPDIEIRRRLPSVKELAKQFSGQNQTGEVRRSSIVRNQMVHSLTARSMSKEFREGLKNNVNKTYNRNVKTNDHDECSLMQENQTEEAQEVQNAVETTDQN